MSHTLTRPQRKQNASDITLDSNVTVVSNRDGNTLPPIRTVLDELRHRSIKVYLPSGRDGPAFVEDYLPTGQVAFFELAPRFARILVLLEEARGQNASVYGFRSASQLSQSVFDEAGWRLEDKTVGRYVGEIIRRHAKAVSAVAVGFAAELLERRRQTGYRVMPDLEVCIVDGDAISGASSA